jgi:GT2 family glycosyltransferase
VITFVILHYQNIDVTNKCVGYLKELKEFEYCHVVIVDNASPNKSGDILQMTYGKYKNIDVIILENNLGFASGNNVGYCYAKQKFCNDVIVVMNSDVYIEDTEFVYKVKKSLEINNTVSIIAPNIYAMKGFYQNPLDDKYPKTRSVKKWRMKVSLLYMLLCIPGLSKYFAILLQKTHNNRDEQKKIPSTQIENHIVPHGACVIYNKNWIKREDFAFVPGTFMYCEEYLVAAYSTKHGHTICFDPSISVVHEAGASTKHDNDKDIQKLKFFYKNEGKSLSLLIKLLNEKR